MLRMYTDGSYLRSKDTGGWAYRFEYCGKIYTGTGAMEGTTTNVMELQAVIEGMKRMLRLGLSTKEILIISDSQYVVYGATTWITAWKYDNWINASGKLVANRGQWEELDALKGRFRRATFQWVRGHNGNAGNEIVDSLANRAATQFAAAPS